MVDNTFSYGDVVQVTGTSTQLAPQRLVRRPEHPPRHSLQGSTIY